MDILNKTLEELITLIQSNEFDDVDDNLAFKIIDRINELKQEDIKYKGNLKDLIDKNTILYVDNN